MSYLSLLILSALFSKVSCIINGIKALHSEFPSIVLIKYKDSFYCGGTLLLPRYVLTSGVCGSREDRIVGVGIGFVDLFIIGSGVILPIEGVEVHPKFKLGNTSAENDLALIKLKFPLEFTETMTALPIYEKLPDNGTHCKTAGWGMVNPEVLVKSNVSKHWPTENVLRKTVQVIAHVEDCQRLLAGSDFLKLNESNHICTRGIDQDQGPSLGDFGGPLICDGQLAGISTHSLYAKNGFLYTVYTPIIASEKWIRKIVGEDLLQIEEEAPKPEDNTIYFDSKQRMKDVNFTARIGADRGYGGGSYGLKFCINIYFIAITIMVHSLYLFS